MLPIELARGLLNRQALDPVFPWIFLVIGQRGRDECDELLSFDRGKNSSAFISFAGKMAGRRAYDEPTGRGRFDNRQSPRQQARSSRHRLRSSPP